MGALIAQNAQAPIRGDWTVMGRPRQAPMRSHLARLDGQRKYTQSIVA